MGRTLDMQIGPPATEAELRALPKAAVAAELRQRVMRMGGVSDEVFVWPSHVTW